MTEKLPTVTTIYPPGSWGEDLESAKQWIVNNLDWAVPALIILVIVAVIALGVWLWLGKKKKSAASNPANQKQGNDNNHSSQIAASGSGATAIQQHIYNGAPVEEHAKVLAENIDLKRQKTEVDRQLEQAQAAATAAANNPNTSDVLRQTLTKANDLLQQGKMADLQKLLQPIEQEQAATIAAIQDMIAVSYMATKDFLNAEIYYRKAYNLQPNSYGHAHNLGWVLHEQYNCTEALLYYRQAEKIARRNSPNSQALTKTLNNIGNLYTSLNKFEEAGIAFSEALQLSRHEANKNSDVYKCNLAMILMNLGVLHARIGKFEEAEHARIRKFEEAEEAFEEALQLYRALAKTNPDTYIPYLIITLTNLGNVHANRVRYEDAKKVLSEAKKLLLILIQDYPDVYKSDLKSVGNKLELLEQLKKQQEAA